MTKKVIKERSVLAVSVTVLAVSVTVLAVAVIVLAVFISCDIFRRYFRRPSNEVGKTGLEPEGVCLGR